MSVGKKINRSELEHVAHLARIRLTDEEIDRFLPQIETVLEYLDQLITKDTSNVKPSFQIIDSKNIFREDKIGKCLTQTEALSSAVRTDNGYFVVPATIKK